MPTRYQVLQQLALSKPFNQNEEGRTYQEFKKMAQIIEDDKDSVEKIESDYWDMVDNQMGPDRLVEYAADISTQQFGSGFGRPGQRVIDPRQTEYLRHPWNLNNIPT